ncbi:MAG: T9SS C-terminal target domain-containing protein [Bacteroidales bacterium]|nr:T9SS C-terminal target domain-containing protein [Bacteroidales bacterium]
MRKSFLIFLMAFSLEFAFSQTSMEMAIHKDSSVFVAWASSAEVTRGYVNIADTNFTYTDAASGITSNYAFYGDVEDCLGMANGNFVSLGDGGSVTLQFDSPIINGAGPDFAVFENALFVPPNQRDIVFAELAFVEVSSNGVDFARFPAYSSAPTDAQIGTFGAVPMAYYHNFPGVFPVMYGYPFDLDDISDPNVDVNYITHIRLIDVVGSVNPDFASYDSQGNIVNDPFPTPFHSSGFDLDAVGVIHNLSSVGEFFGIETDIFPKPAAILQNRCDPSEPDHVDSQPVCHTP